MLAHGHHQAAVARAQPDGPQRLVALLHEAQHLRGRNEATALAEVWRVKARVGWTAAAFDYYSEMGRNFAGRVIPAPVKAALAMTLAIPVAPRLAEQYLGQLALSDCLGQAAPYTLARGRRYDWSVRRLGSGRGGCSRAGP